MNEVVYSVLVPEALFLKVSSDDIEKRADRTLHGLDPKNTVYLHGFDQALTTYFFRNFIRSIRTKLSTGSCMQTK